VVLLTELVKQHLPPPSPNFNVSWLDIAPITENLERNLYGAMKIEHGIDLTNAKNYWL